MRRLINWIRGWKATLEIKFFTPDVYDFLKKPMDPDDFTEVQRPCGEEDGT